MILGTRKLPTLFDKRLWSFVTTVNQDYPKGLYRHSTLDRCISQTEECRESWPLANTT